MDTLTIILILLIALAIFLFINQNKKNIKAPAVKKEEIIEAYKFQMKEVIEKYNNDKVKQKEEKVKLLKKINYELSMNLFFDEEESKKIISELLKIS